MKAVVLVTQHPRMDEHVLIRERRKGPGCIGVRELAHLVHQRFPLLAWRRAARLLVEAVVVRLPEAGEVRKSGVAAVEQPKEPEPLWCRGGGESLEHLQLPEPRGLQQVLELLLVELDAHA